MVNFKKVNERKRRALLQHKSNMVLKSKKLEIIGEFAACVAHEIRNPLTSMKGFVQLLEKGTVHPDYLEQIHSACDQIEQYITELLLLAQPQQVSKKLVNIRLLLEDVIDTVEDKVVQKKILFNRQYELEESPLIVCDPAQISKVVLHLLSNSIEAIQYTGTIYIDVKNKDGKLVIKISDNGVGMSKERLAKLGEPFFSTKEKGTGIGFMQCYQIVSQHDGKIMVNSEENLGTTVEVTLPITVEE